MRLFNTEAVRDRVLLPPVRRTGSVRSSAQKWPFAGHTRRFGWRGMPHMGCAQAFAAGSDHCAWMGGMVAGPMPIAFTTRASHGRDPDPTGPTVPYSPQ